MTRLFLTGVYFWRYLKLVIHCGVVWGIHARTPQEFADEVRRTPQALAFEQLMELRRKLGVKKEWD